MATENRVPLVGTIAGSSALARFRNDYVFSVRQGYDKEAEAIAAQLAVMGTSRLAILSADSKTSERVAALAQPLSRADIQADMIDLRSSDSTSAAAALNRIRDGDYQAVVLDLSGFDIDRMAARNQIVSADWPSVLFTFADSALFSAAGVFRQQVIGFTSVVPNPDADAIPLAFELRRNAEAFQATYVTSFESMETCINTKVCVEAVRRAGGGDSPERVAQSLRGMRGYDLGGYTVSFD